MSITLPFARTTCACPDCVQCCKTQPGPLIPGDLERIATFLNLPLEEAKIFFWASDGAMVQDQATGRIRRVRTITPKYAHGKCVFLDANDRCRIHPVAPAGCAYFDTHMDAVEGMRRGLTIVHLQDTIDYQVQRGTLDLATHHKPRRY